MPSPFPGMDPYLEGAMWPDVHGSLLYTVRAALAAALPDGYAAVIDQYVWLQAGEADAADRRERAGQPDVAVAAGRSTAPAAAGAVVAEPTARVSLTAGRRTKARRHVRLVDRFDRRVVTVVEVLSPSNKAAGDDRDQYLLKRNEYLAGDTHLVEVDLLRAGDRPPMGRPRPPAADYYLLVSRADARSRADVWAFTVRDPIPVIPVPLRPADGSVPLDLRACLDRAYDEGRYDRTIDYTRPPDPPLRRPDADWAAGLLAGRGA